MIYFNSRGGTCLSLVLLTLHKPSIDYCSLDLYSCLVSVLAARVSITWPISVDLPLSCRTRRNAGSSLWLKHTLTCSAAFQQYFLEDVEWNAKKKTHSTVSFSALKSSVLSRCTP